MTLDHGSDPSIMARLGEDNRPGETNRMSTYEFGTIHGRSKSNNISRSFKTPFGYAMNGVFTGIFKRRDKIYNSLVLSTILH